MSYHDELSARLEAVRNVTNEQNSAVTVQTQVEKVLQELDREFEFAQYDLEESDILRTLKILNALKSYEKVFAHKEALRLFYVLSRVDAIMPKQLQSFMELPSATLKAILNAMAQSRLLFQNESKELELTLEGKSLAARIGIDIYI